jgi:hypothetical protein
MMQGFPFHKTRFLGSLPVAVRDRVGFCTLEDDRLTVGLPFDGLAGVAGSGELGASLISFDFVAEVVFVSKGAGTFSLRSASLGGTGGGSSLGGTAGGSAYFDWSISSIVTLGPFA